MAHVVHRIGLGFPGDKVILPRGAVVLRVGLRPADGEASLWYRVGTESLGDNEPRRFFVVGTGHEFDEKATYIGTFETGALVWHVFEAVKP